MTSKHSATHSFSPDLHRLTVQCVRRVADQDATSGEDA